MVTVAVTPGCDAAQQTMTRTHAPLHVSIITIRHLQKLFSTIFWLSFVILEQAKIIIIGFYLDIHICMDWKSLIYTCEVIKMFI